MAKCDEGYLCEVCGIAVERLDESALYLQFVIGWIDPETLHTRRECHLRCHPALAQYIDDSRFDPPVLVDDEFDRRQLDTEFVKDRAELISQGFARLCELQKRRRDLSVHDYPLEDVRAKWQQ